MFETFVGIVKGPDDKSVSIGILIPEKKQIESATFTINNAWFNHYYTPLATGKFDLVFTPDLMEVSDFLHQHIANPKTARFLVEVPKIYPYPLDMHESAPCALLKKDAVVLKIIALLSAKGYISWMFNTDENSTNVLIEQIRGPEYADLRKNQPIFIADHISHTYARFFLESSPSYQQASVIAAMIAKNRGAFFYWSSFGMVQSAQDIVSYLKTDQKTATSIISANEVYTTSKQETTKYDGIDKITLEYLITSKKYELLGNNDAIKAALVQVCKKWQIKLSCTSWREDADESDEDAFRDLSEEIEGATNGSYFVYPLPAEDSWIISTIS